MRSRFGIGLLLVLARAAAAQGLYQTDLKVQTLDVTRVREGLMAHAVVGVLAGESDAPSRGTSVQVLLPVGVGVIRMSEGCVLGASAPGVSVLRARVICDLGIVANRATREVTVFTTVPPNGVAKTFGVVALSDTPDPRPANNFAERTLP